MWECRQKGELFGLKSAVSSLSISDNFHVLLSTSLEGGMLLWDTNRYSTTFKAPPARLEFVRRLAKERRPEAAPETLRLSCVSNVSGDLAVVFQSALASRVSLYTLNGDLVGTHVDEQRIQSLTMTALDEGSGVNCLALGLHTGAIRLLDMWTLSTVRLISCQNLHSPVLSLRFTNDGRRLFAALSNSHVICWQVHSLAKAKLPLFSMINPFL